MRQRAEANSHLPANLYRQANGYFYYRHPQTKKIVGIGRDETIAVAEAIKLNASAASRTEAGRQQKLAVARTNFAVDSDGLVELQFLRENAELYDKVCGIYFLMEDGEVVYVGQSVNCHSRISDHVRLEQKQFDSVYIIRADREALTQLENLYIKKFNPKYNSLANEPTRKTAWGIRQRFNEMHR